MANDELIARDDQRRFSLIYHDFVESKLLDYYEKMIFICLKKYADNDTRQAYPSLSTISRITGISKRKVQNCLKHMQELGVVTCKRRKTENGDYTSNLYVLHDYAKLWKDGTISDDETEPDEDQAVIERLKQKGYIVIKQKDFAEASTTTPKQSPQNSIIPKRNNTENQEKSQVSERYSEQTINDYYHLDELKAENPTKESLINDVSNILYTLLNTDEPTIRVGGQDKPTLIVVSRMLRLNQDMIMYVIDQFVGLTEKVKNQRAYITTCLYNVHEQYNLALRNQVSHDLAHYED